MLPLLDAIRVPRIGPGRPGKHPEHLTADKAYSHPSTGVVLRKRRIRHTVPEKSDQIAHRAGRGSRGGRPLVLDAARYEERNVVERCFNRLEQYRALVTRYAKRAAHHRATPCSSPPSCGSDDPQDRPWPRAVSATGDDAQARRLEVSLRVHLRGLRARTRPEALGLPRGQGRRLLGLRREEVAVLAGMHRRPGHSC